MGELLETLPDMGPATYAGRLDPLASGVCVVLSGDNRHEKERFLNLNKTYLVDVALGIGTDTHDPLGILTNYSPRLVGLTEIEEVVQSFTPEYIQIPPKFSSVLVDGKPSFMQAREKDSVEPKGRPVSIATIDILSVLNVDSTTLAEDCIARVKQVNGDFRQEAIIASWKELGQQTSNPLVVCKLRVTCGSGTYMRSLARDLGTKLNTPCIALRIIRERVGDFRL